MGKHAAGQTLIAVWLSEDELARLDAEVGTSRSEKLRGLLAVSDKTLAQFNWEQVVRDCLKQGNVGLLVASKIVQGLLKTPAEKAQWRQKFL